MQALQYIEDMGFPPEVLTALRLLTHKKCESYMEYVCRAAWDPVAKAVKLAAMIREVKEKIKAEKEQPKV